MTTDPQASVPLAQSLRAREAGLPLDTTLYEGVPPHLDGPLRAWARAFIAGALEQRVALQMGITTSQSYLQAALDTAHGRPGHLVDQLQSGSQLLEAIDRALRLDQRLHWEVDVVGMEEDRSQASLADWIPLHRWPRSSHRATAVAGLAQLLRDASSAYYVSWDVPLHLARRVDPTVQAAVDETTATADPGTAELLSRAWTQVYGRDPTSGYHTAVRAVETVARPLVLPNNQRATLGQVIAHLRDASGRWELGLVDKNGDGSIEPLVAMLGPALASAGLSPWRRRRLPGPDSGRGGGSGSAGCAVRSLAVHRRPAPPMTAPRLAVRPGHRGSAGPPEPASSGPAVATPLNFVAPALSFADAATLGFVALHSRVERQ